MNRNPYLQMAGEKGQDDGADYPTCDVTCSTTGCQKKCCKENTPTHAAYGIHACSDHK